MRILKYNSSNEDKRGGTGNYNKDTAVRVNESTQIPDTDLSSLGESMWARGGGANSLIPKESYNVAEGADSVAIGANTQTTNQGELATGVFNSSTPDETMFSVGDGTDAGTRHNIFEVTKGGNTKQDGIAEVGTKVITPVIDAEQGDIDNVNAKNVVTDKLSVNVQAYIKELLAGDITTENLTVTKAAHFFKLVIDEIKSSKGQLIITPANAVLDLVEDGGSYWKCYFRASDGDGRKIRNSFEANDQVICQTFNAAQGTSYNVSNRFYWMLCTSVGGNVVKKNINGEDVDCWYINISKTNSDSRSNAVPAAGDEIVMLGNRVNASRQSAIIISAYNNTYLDPELKSPSFVQYDGIKTYELKPYRKNVISKGYNNFVGEFHLTSGKDVEEAIEESLSYIHQAWANSADGSRDFTKVNDGQHVYDYIGLCSTKTESDASLVYSDYTWTSIRGTGITNTSITYQRSTNGETVPQGEWVTTVPVLQSGDWLWTRIIIYYSDNTSDTSYNISRMGEDGSCVHVAYSTSADGHDDFSLTVFPTAKYIGIYVDNNYESSSDYTKYSWARMRGYDGNSIEFIYTRNNTGIAPDRPERTQIDRDVPEGWSDHPQGVTASIIYEYVSTRDKIDGTWSSWSQPVVWSKWGDKGTDGDGYEYIYKTTTTNTAPTKPDTSQADDYRPGDWTDNPSGVTSVNKFEWVCVRKKENGKWGQFSDPALWARYAEQGDQGPHYEFRYKNAAKQPSYPTGSGLTDGWKATASTPSPGTYTWMSQALATPSGDNYTYGTWTDPTRITGDKGIDGADGTTFEFIYARNNTGVAPTKPEKSQVDDYHPDPWTDHPQGVTASLMYEYVSTRSKTNGTWSAFSDPVIWSKWGEKGVDGDGYEYIYKTTTTNSAPSTPAQSQVDKDVPSGGWTADPSGVTSTNKFEWVSTRKKTNGVWSKWSTPALWARYAEQGDQGPHYEFRYKNAAEQPSKPTGAGTTGGWSANPETPSESGSYTWMSQALATPSASGYTYGAWSDPIRITGNDGQNGTDGNSIEFIYTRNNTGVTPDTPDSIQRDNYYPSGWSDNPKGVTATLMYEYVSTRSKKNGKWDEFSTPAVWSKWGEKGMDGDGYEYIYKLTTTNTNPGKPYNKDEDGYVPEAWGWTADPSGVTSTNKFEWCSVRKKTNGHWNDFSNPALWARYAEQGDQGPHYEFRYKNAAKQPDKPTGAGTSDNWFATPSTPDKGTYTWMSQCLYNNAYGTWTNPIRITGDDGQNGTDGNSVEFIYTRNNTGTTPDTPSSVDRDNYVPGGWKNNPQGVTASMMYEYVSTRSKKNGKWGDFSTPAVWSKWGEKGMDGDGYEYIYTRTTTSSTPSDPSYRDEDGYVPYPWENNPKGVSSSNKFEWVSTRKKENGKWSQWSTPALWARYAEQGDQGPHYEFRYKNAAKQPSYPTGSGLTDGWKATASTPDKGTYTWMSQSLATPSASGYSYGTWTNPIRITGDDGKDGTDGKSIEFIYTRNNTGTTPDTPSSVDRDDYYPSGWSDNPKGVTATLMYEYVSTRSKKNGKWDDFSTPVIWSKWGEKGMDGDGYEYIYTRTTTNTKPSKPSSASYPWYDNPKGVSSTDKFEWVSTRKKTNGKWSAFSEPALWASYAEKGDKGDNGSHYEFRYKNAAKQPSKPTGTGLTDNWKATPENPTAKGVYTWMSQSNVTGTTYGTWTVPIRITGSDGKDGTDGVDGTSSITYKLVPVVEKAAVTSKTSGTSTVSGNLVINFQYNVLKVDGTAVETIAVYKSGNGWFLRTKSNLDNTWNNFSDNTTTPSYSKTVNNYHDQNNKQSYYTVELVNKSTVHDKRIIPVILEAEATLDITDSITSRVQGTETTVSNLNTTVTNHTNSISTIDQKYNKISSKVESNTTSINNLTGEVQDLGNDVSEIKQDSQNIELNVYNNLEKTGINITKRLITIDSNNTVFNGNITMQNPNEGLIVNDNNGNPRINIQNNSLGTLSSFDFGTNKAIPMREETTYSSWQPTITYTFAAQSLGTLEPNHTVYLSDMGFNGYYTSNPFTTTINSASYEYTIKRGSSVITTKSGDASKVSSKWPNEWRISNSSFSTGYNTGKFTITLKVTLHLSLDTRSYKGQFCWSAYVNSYTARTNMSRLATDGAVFAASNTQYNWFGSDMTQLRNGKSAMRLSGGNLQRNSYNVGSDAFMDKWSDLSSTMPYAVVNTTNYNASVNDCIILMSTVVGSTSQRTLKLPAANTCPGKIYFVKNGSSNTCRVTSSTSNNFMWHSDRRVINQIDNIGNESYMFVSCSLYWISFNCD